VCLRVFRPADVEALLSLVRTSGDRLAPRLTMARTGDGARTLLRPARNRPTLPAAPWPGTGYVAHPHLPNLYLPDGHALRPTPRPARLATLFELRPDGLTWLEPDGAGVRAFTVPFAAFRRPSLAVSVPRRGRLSTTGRGDDPFRPAPYVVPSSAPTGPRPPTRPVVGPGVGPPNPDGGWVAKLVQSLTAPRGDEPRADDPPPRLPPAETLAVGPARAARRRELEGLVLRRLPGLPATDRADLWADLADAYSVARRPADAALCWLNAVWDHPDPPAPWYDGWVREESRGAVKPAAHGPMTLAQTRFLAARFVRAAARGLAIPDSPGTLARAVDESEPDLPVRLVWLVRAAAAPQDALALARARDALVKRLADAGPALDRDAPAFLRFAGRPDDARDVRDWVLRTRDPAKRWVGRVAGRGKLQWFGLDGEAEATAAYAEYLFAWASGRCGERAAAVGGQASAELTLTKCGGPVHAYLRAAFRDRIRDARDGRPPRPHGTPFSGDAFDHFCVNKFHETIRVFDPNGPARGETLPDGGNSLDAWVHALPLRLREPGRGERDLARLAAAALVVAERTARPEPVAVAFEFLTGTDAPPAPALGAVLDRVGNDLFAACRRFGFDVRPLVRRVVPPAGSPGDVRSAVAGAGWLAAGDEDRGMERLDACRERLYAVDGPDPRAKAALAVATASALALAPRRVALGRLEELFQRLDGIDVTGSTNRYFTLRPLEVIDAAVRAALGDATAASPEIADWLAADERVILSRCEREIRHRS
jgi:hypothetical protein